MKGELRIGLLISAVFVAGMTLSVETYAAAAGEVTTLRGRITAATADGRIRALRRGSVVNSGDTLDAGHASFVKLKFSDGAAVYLRQNSRFRVDEFVNSGEPKKDKSFFSLVRGGMRFLSGLVGSRNRAAFRVKTRFATIGIRGTDGQLRLCQGDCPPGQPDGLNVQTNDGTLIVGNAQGEAPVPKNQFAFVCPTCAPEATVQQPDVFKVEFYPSADTPEEPEMDAVCQ